MLAPAARAYALEFPQWGHRKIAALMRVDGHHAPESTVLRALRDAELTLPAGHQRQSRALAGARREAFLDPPSRRNRVWQTDFTELETSGGGTWQISPVCDYVTKLSIACPVTATARWQDAVATLEDARAAVAALLGRSLLEDCTDPATGEITPVIVVTDNGSCYKAAAFARYIASRPELLHVRTRKKSPHTNGVVECFNRVLKYEDLYRDLPADGLDLTLRAAAHRDLHNTVRPHEHLAWARPLETFLAEPSATTPTRQAEQIA